MPYKKECPLRPAPEFLERRLCLNGDFAFLQPDGELIVLGTIDRDVISVEGDGLIVRAILNGKIASFPSALVQSLYIDARDRADMVVNATGLPAIIDGGQGDDTLIGGWGRDTIFGNSGNDLIDGGTGEDEIHGGPGFDVLSYESFAPGSFSVLQFGSATVSIEVYADRSGGGRDRDIVSPLDIEVMRFTKGNDTLIVDTSGPFLVDGGPGNDIIRASYRGEFIIPDNSVAGGAGDDSIFLHSERPPGGVLGGEGDDLIFDSYGNTSTHLDFVQLDGGPGFDRVLIGGDSNSHDALYITPPGIEMVHHRGQFGFTLLGNELDNILIAGDGSEFFPVTIDGAGGNDTIIGSMLADLLLGGAGNDLILAGGGDDSVEGGDGNDTLVAGPGANVLRGGAGDDWLIAFPDKFPDTLDGGTGFDRVILRGPVGADVFQSVELILPAERSRVVVDLLG